MNLIRLMLGLSCWMALACLLTPLTAEEAAYSRPVLIRVTGPIDDWFESTLLRKLAIAEEMQCDLLVLEIDSPGGGLEETLRLCDHLIGMKQMRIVAFVPNEALSGAAILSLACHEIVLADSARIGDCGPIYLAEDFLFRHAPEKIRSNLIARVRAFSEQRGHAAALAEAMVDMDSAVVRVTHKTSGESAWRTERELTNLEAEWERGETLPETGGGRFLTLTGKRALEVGLAKRSATSLEQLATDLKVTEPFTILQPNTTDRVVYFLNHWFITGIILIIGLLAFAAEFSAGISGGGAVIGTLCFALFFWSHFLGGTAGWLEVVLFLCGVIFLAIEIFVLPGFGVAGFVGIALILSALVLALLDFSVPHSNAQLMRGAEGVLVVMCSVGVSTVIAAIMLRHLESIPILNRLMLKPPGSEPVAVEAEKQAKLSSSQEDARLMVGDFGETLTMLRPAGKARFGELVLDVVSEGSLIEPGVRIRVTGLQGTRIVVERLG